jgi:hypothetical protein
MNWSALFSLSGESLSSLSLLVSLTLEVLLFLAGIEMVLGKSFKNIMPGSFW